MVPTQASGSLKFSYSNLASQKNKLRDLQRAKKEEFEKVLK